MGVGFRPSGWRKMTKCGGDDLKGGGWGKYMGVSSVLSSGVGRGGRRRDDRALGRGSHQGRRATLDAVNSILHQVCRGVGRWVHDSRIADVDARRATEILMAGTCLAILALVVGRSARRPWSENPGRPWFWILGGLLTICGGLQFLDGVWGSVTTPETWLGLLTAVACWGAAGSVLCPSAMRANLRNYESFEREITGRQLAEAALRNSEAEAKKLAEADTRKNEFLAMLGHELRNPLAPIRNALKIMKQSGSDDPNLCWARDVVDHQVRQMAQLVDDLLDISRVTSGKVRLQKEAVDVGTIVAYAVETSRPTIEAAHHRLSISLPGEVVKVEADSIRMAQVLSNLLNNAAKYTNPGGRIRVTVAADGSDVVFRIRDNGIGIPHEMLARIFDLFAQVDRSLDHSQGGLGLGLTLVKSLVEMHGGSVEARSEGLSLGSEFVVRLPVLREEPTAAEPAAPADVPGPAARPAVSRRVLVVDDNVASAQSLAMVLNLDGHEVQVVHDGTEAIEAVRRFRPAAVLMDIGLPGMDGYEVARRLRDDLDLAKGLALVVAVTGYAEDEARKRSSEAGFDHHLVKPVDPDMVLALIGSLEWDDDHAGREPDAATESLTAGSAADSDGRRRTS